MEVGFKLGLLRSFKKQIQPELSRRILAYRGQRKIPKVI
jgi:hypothetical protein